MLRSANEMNILTTDCQYAARRDEELLEEYRSAKNREAFNQLVIRYEAELYRYLYHYLGGNSANAEDVFQTVFIRIIERIDTFDSDKKFRPWLYRIAANCANDFLHKRKRFNVISIDEEFGRDGEALTIAETLEGRETLPETKAVSDEEARRVRDAVNLLPEKTKQALLLVYFQGLTYSEAAETLGIVKGSMPGRLRSAVDNLNNILKRQSQVRNDKT
ncbi:MAG: sigma-70 family RNA polymerase sigma factor [Planctomycetaceae bacterium]|jgi:RNA polymerase sigma-70 factor (ECF subfamily)|nr:sigma-70 family RNA polymerase sigma factor [Planctomycetaceae bacterium]